MFREVKVSFVFVQERMIVNTLQFDMSVPTPYCFMRRFLKAAQSDKKVGQKHTGASIFVLIYSSFAM
jgi:hypothetical protein